MISKVVLFVFLGVLRRFQHHICQITPSQFTNSWDLGESSQLCNRTENSVVRRAIAHHVFRGQCDCIVGVYRPFSTAFMSNHPHSSQTPGTWVNQPSYAVGLKTVWKEEPLLIMISKVVLFVLLGVLRRFQHRICQITRTVHILMRPGWFNWTHCDKGSNCPPCFQKSFCLYCWVF